MAAMKEAVRAVTRERVQEIIIVDGCRPNTWMEWRAVCFFPVQNNKDLVSEDRKKLAEWMASGDARDSKLERLDSITKRMQEFSIESDAKSMEIIKRMPDIKDNILQEAIDLAKTDFEKEMYARKEGFGK